MVDTSGKGGEPPGGFSGADSRIEDMQQLILAGVVKEGFDIGRNVRAMKRLIRHENEMIGWQPYYADDSDISARKISSMIRNTEHKIVIYASELLIHIDEENWEDRLYGLLAS